jgi:iron(III) transport system ATP-binding protein
VAVLKITNLVKKYGDLVVVDHLNLDVADGEFVTLLGPSGCGKTTTLRAVAGLVEIDGGQIYFDDRLMNDVPAHKRSASLVFQSYALFPHMTVQQNIAFGLRMRHVPRGQQEKTVAEAMTMVGLEGLGARNPAHLSGGQQQRVALARAIVTQPDLLLFDEPLSNLDANLRERLRVEIKELQRRLRITCLYVTHDQAEAMVMSDRIVVMNKGTIQQIGDPATIYRQPANSFTAEFIGQTNILTARIVSASSDGCELDSPVGRLFCARGPASADTEVLITWRPEDMVPYESGMRNRVSARVTHSAFMGNVTDLALDAGGVALRAQRPGSVPWQKGDDVVLGVAEDRIQILQ